MNNKITIFLGHPAHFHLFKNAAQNLIDEGFEVIFLIKRKDILEDLVKGAGYKYVVVREHERNSSSKLGLIWSMLKMDAKVFHYLLYHRSRLLIGTYCPVISRILFVPFVSTNEDDAAVVPKFANLSYPSAKAVLSPKACNNGKWEPKTIHYPGFQKLAYLHPNQFTPDKSVVEKYGIDTSKPYFIIRFALLKAHHDGGVQGISTEVAQHIIDLLAPHGNIYITSERALEPQFEPYRLKINPLDIHHVMAYATLYLGDSQSMAVEAAMLGTPSLRFNDFVGAKRIGVMEELEHTYGLTFGISSHEPERLYDQINTLLAMPNLKEEFQARRQRMLSEKIDVTRFLTWFIENYPASASEARDLNFDWTKFK